MSGARLEIAGLGKDFGEFTAVAAIDFQVFAQEIFGFLGPNGAGKSTTINMLATLLRPSRGRAALAGYDVAAHEDRRVLRYLSEHGLERGEVAVDVVERGDRHGPR